MSTPTLHDLAEIGAEAAYGAIGGTHVCMLDTMDGYHTHRPAREAFVQAVLDAVGYKFPVDPEREAFDVWLAANPSRSSNDDLFDAWLAGRDELRSTFAKTTVAADASAKQAETFTAHGHTWFKHTPGDPCPCDPMAKICIWVGDELCNNGRTTRIASSWNWNTKTPGSAILGWRYADADS